MAPGADNWIHRSSNMVCGTCVFYVGKGLAPTAGLESDVEPLGRCRRHCPTLAGFPAVFSTDWCGDHKLVSWSENPVSKGVSSGTR